MADAEDISLAARVWRDRYHALRNESADVVGKLRDENASLKHQLSQLHYVASMYNTPGGP